MPRRKTRLGLVRGPARHRAAQAGLRASAPAPRRSRVSCERMPLEAAARPPTLAETGARRKEWCSQARRRPARALRPWSRLREAHNSPAEDVFRGKEMATQDTSMRRLTQSAHLCCAHIHQVLGFVRAEEAHDSSKR